ncbi:MAG: hypothetical protein J4F28_07260 [Nitrosopumilaceae archaeon]|nr:hypothetical protein [Nitrosopumilaceae archaeon]
MTARIDIPYDVLHKKYVLERKSAPQIAAETEWSVSAVYANLKRYRIKRRTRRIDLPYGVLYEMYVVKNKTADQIAAERGWSRDSVRNNLKRHGIKMRPDNSKRRGPHLTEAEFRHLYQGEGLTIPDIERKTGISRHKLNRMFRHVPRHSTGYQSRTAMAVSLETVKRLHYNKGIGCAAIDKKYGLCNTKSWNMLQKAKLPVNGAKFEITEARLRDQIELQYKTAGDIAHDIGVSGNVIWTRMKRYGIVDAKNTSYMPTPSKKEIDGLRAARIDLRRYMGHSSPGSAAAVKKEGYMLRNLMLEMLGGGRCAVCFRTERLQIHHMWDLPEEDEVKYSDYPSHRMYEYYARLYPLVSDNPGRFVVLCALCHKITGLLQGRPPHTRTRLWDMVVTMQRHRTGKPSFSDISREWAAGRRGKRGRA